MAYNTIDEIKSKLLLESENQTLSDTELEAELNDANDEMVSIIGRTTERDEFISEEYGTVIFYPYFNVVKIKRVKVNNNFLDSSKFRVSFDKDGVEIDDIQIGDVVEIFSIPSNYKSFEKAICIVNIKTRLNPFKNNAVDPIYNEWVLKRDNFKKALLSKFGTGLYSG